jgi:hypothetical protein
LSTSRISADVKQKQIKGILDDSWKLLLAEYFQSRHSASVLVCIATRRASRFYRLGLYVDERWIEDTPLRRGNIL